MAREWFPGAKAHGRLPDRLGFAESSLRLRVLPGASVAAPEPDLRLFDDDQMALTLARRAGLGDRVEVRLRLGEPGREIPSNPLHYLAYGPIYQKERKKYCRPYLPPAAKAATVELSWRRPLPPDDERELFDLAWSAWLHLGGVGSRSRKGWGSLQAGPVGPQRADFRAQVAAIRAVGEGFADEPAWTHLSRGSRIFVGRETAATWKEALSHLGSWLVAFRRRYGADFDERVELRGRDYAWASPKGRAPRQGIPDRAGFGLPLPFSKTETITWIDPDRQGEPGTARRASPLLLHVAHLAEGFLPVLTHLPARFLPEGSRLAFEKGAQPLAARQEIQPGQRDVVTRFLGGLASRRLIEEVR